MLAERCDSRSVDMDEPPRNECVASRAGIPVSDVERYRLSTTRRKNGSWLVSFSFDMPKQLRGNLTGSFTLILPPSDRFRIRPASVGVHNTRCAGADLLAALRKASLLVKQGKVGSPEWRLANERQLQAERDLLFAMS